MTRTIAHLSPLLRPMEDSVNWAVISTTEPLVAGYVLPSHFAWPPAAWARFPRSTLVRITPSASVWGPGIQVLDIETGDATAAQAPGWALNSRAVGQEPTSYCSMSLWPTVIRAFTAARVPVSEFWVAGYPGGGAVLPSITVDGVTYTAVAHQYADPNTSGGDYDLSVVADYWRGVDGGFDVTTAEQITDIQFRVASMHAGGYLPWPGAPGAPGGDLTWFQQQTKTALAPVLAQLSAIQGALTADEAALLGAIQATDADGKAGVIQLAAAIAAQPTGAQVDVAALATDLAADLPAQATPAQFVAALAAALTKQGGTS
jgi:hypothetical protein